MKTSVTQEDKLVLSKASDTIYLAEKRHCLSCYGFLNEHQAQLIKDNLYLDDSCTFCGGYEDARRVFFCVNLDKSEELPFVCVKFTYKPEYNLSHRDFLGALMSIGIERSTIGDILVFEGESYIFIKREIADFICSQISKVGSVGVVISIVDNPSLGFKQEFQEIKFTVSSNRLDAFVSALCRISRDKSQQMIKSDLVSVNHSVVNNSSRILKTGDILTIRKYGKFVFAVEDGVSKKGRNRITVNHYR